MYKFFYNYQMFSFILAISSIFSFSIFIFVIEFINMKNLYIIRHAKSSWELPVSDDLRPLNERGINDAYLIGNALQFYGLESVDVYVSAAKRTQETYDIIKTSIAHLIKSENTTRELYTFNHRELVNFIKKTPNNQDAILIFGHNFAITDFVNAYGSKIIDNVSTCGFIHLQFNINDWQQLKRGETIKKIFPKDLK